MIELLRVEAVNFRSLGHVVVEPASTGSLTALTGPNGAGKSSVVSAVLWALYGVTPDGVPVPGLRRQGTDTSEECWVRVTFSHAGQTVEILRALKGAKNATIASISVDGVDTTVASTKTATAWVQARLGLDADGFTTAVLVRQKELEDLVRAKPADRKRAIERLAGIERMSEAVTNAREVESEARKDLTRAGEPEIDLDAATTALAEATAAEQSAVHAHDAAQEAVDTATSQEASTRAVLDDLTAAWQAHQQAQAAMAQARDQVTAATAARDAHVSATADLLAADPVDAATASAALAEAETAVAQAARAEQDAAAARSSLDAARREATAAEQAVTGTEHALTAATTRVTTAHAALDSAPVVDAVTLAELSATAQAANERVGQLRAEYTRLTRAIDALDHAAGGACPTCNQHVADTAALLTDLRGDLAVVQQDGTNAKAAVEQAQASLEQAQAANRAHDTATQALDAATATAATAGSQHQAATERLTLAQSTLAELEGTVLDPAVLAQATATAQATRDAAKRTVDTAAAAATARTRRDELTAALTLAQDAYAAATQTTSTPVDEQALAAARADHQAAVTALTGHRDALAEARTAAALASDRANNARTAITRAQAAVDAKAALAEAAERAVATRAALDDFRAERLARLVPELSDTASDLVTRMTGGRMTAVRFDEAFTAHLTDDTGQSRPVAWLSGGEEAVLALALRLAIGDLISGGQAGLLVLDEVLTAQDAERRAAMMAAITDLPGRQVLMVNHVAEATDLADTIIEFTPATGDDGATAHTVSVDVDFDRVLLDV